MVSILLRHGPDGAGNPAIAKMFEVEMRDFTEGKGKMKPCCQRLGPCCRQRGRLPPKLKEMAARVYVKRGARTRHRELVVNQPGFVQIQGRHRKTDHDRNDR
jgi:hypothetical protein